MQTIVKIALPLILIVAALVYFFGGSTNSDLKPSVDSLPVAQDQDLNSGARAETTPQVASDSSVSSTGSAQATSEVVPTVQPTATPGTQSNEDLGNIQMKNIDGVPLHVQEQLTREVQLKFEDLVYLDDLPSDEAEAYKYMNDGFMNSLFYLNEIAAKNIDPTPENLGKAMKFLALYSQRVNASEIDDSLRIIRQEQSERFQEGLRELSESEELIITEVLDNLEREFNSDQ